MSTRRHLKAVAGCTLIAAALAAPRVSPAAGAPDWANPLQKVRARLLVERRPDSHVAWVEFWHAGRADPTGADLQVYERNGSPVNHRVVTVGPGDRFLVALELRAGNDYDLYAGRGTRVAVPNLWTPKAGLFLQTYHAGDTKCSTFEEFEATVRKSTVLFGSGYRDQIFDGYNPFGLSEKYLSVYTGYLRIPKSGTYSMATNSDDASAVFVDGKKVADYLALHGPLMVNGERNGSVTLDQGVHLLEYYHLEAYGGQAAVAGWKKPGDKHFMLIPSEAFVPISRARVVRVEEPAGPLPEFDFRPADIYPVDGERALIGIKFRALGMPTAGVRRLRWEFGDGEGDSAPEAVHVFLAPGLYEVVLTVAGLDGTLRQVRHRVPVDWIEQFNADDPERTGREFDERLSRYTLRAQNPAALETLYAYYALRETPKEKTIPLLRRLAASAPADNPQKRASFILSLAEALESDHSEASVRERRQLLQAVTTSAPDPTTRAKVYVKLGDLALFYDRDLSRAEAAYRAALGLAPASDTERLARIRLADIFLYAGQPDRARDLYRQVPPADVVADRAELFTQAYGHKAETSIRQHKYDEALEALDQWEWEVPEAKLKGYSFWLRVRLAIATDNEAEAVKFCRVIVECLDDPTYKPEAYDVLIRQHLRRGEVAQAKALYAKLRQDFPLSRFVRSLEATIKESDR